jgi:hypothetical protein
MKRELQEVLGLAAGRKREYEQNLVASAELPFPTYIVGMDDERFTRRVQFPTEGTQAPPLIPDLDWNLYLWRQLSLFR